MNVGRRTGAFRTFRDISPLYHVFVGDACAINNMRERLRAHHAQAACVIDMLKLLSADSEIN